MSGVLRGRRGPIRAAHMAPSTGVWVCVCQSPDGERDKGEGLSTVPLFLGSGQAWHLYPMTSCTPQSTQWTLSMQSFQEWGSPASCPIYLLKSSSGLQGAFAQC